MRIELTPRLNPEKLADAFLMLRDHKMRPLFQRINSEYLYWDKVKYLGPKDIDKTILWQAVRIQRDINAQSLRFGKHTFRFTITKNMLALLHDFDMNLGGSLGTENIIPTTDKNYYLISSIMEEAIASSQMEGASTTRRIAKDMLRKQLRPKNKSQQMIVNNYETISKISKNSKEELTEEKLLDIHRSITNKTLDDPEDEGVFRKNDDIYVVDGITGHVSHTPPSYTEIDELIHALCDFANNDDSDNFIHPIIKGIIIHFILAYIHPFSDGNGRTARSLFYWYMIKKGYWLTEYLSISRIIYVNKKSYEKAFQYTESDGNDLSYFIQHHLNVMKKAFEELKKYLQRKIDEQQNILQFVGFLNINERQRYVLKIISDSKRTIFTPKELSTQFNISTRTARTDLQELVGMGYLSTINLNKRAIGYIKSPNFEELLQKSSKR
ncbi:MAG: Fic family protein [Bacteroidales bacterium]|nr:Fic family protein [Bacteroidales bacterium]